MKFDKVVNPVFLRIQDGSKVILTQGSMRDVCKQFEIDYCASPRSLVKSLQQKYNFIVDSLPIDEYSFLRSRISDSNGSIVLV